MIGGISVGTAVAGEFIHDPDGVPGAYSSEAVSDACHPYTQISIDGARCVIDLTAGESCFYVPADPY